jgi:hypothetical protein
MHALIKVLGETKVTARARARGRQASDNELGVVISQIRKYLSASFIRPQSLCLLNRLFFLGEGAKAAAGTVEQYWPFRTNTNTNTIHTAKTAIPIQFHYQYNTN